ncbi:MAG: hypothetical protein WD271_12360 [Acidimicrobiia bacterium]
MRVRVARQLSVRARSRCRALAIVVLVAGGVIAVTAAPAYAHGVGGVQPRNDETKLLRVAPHIPGVELTVVDLGDGLQLTNDTPHDVIVLGYDGEPYLRVGPRGVFENTRSPATYLNRSRIPMSKPPKRADSSARPVWHKVSSGITTTWHDHRAHFMGSEDPPNVRRNPSIRRVIDRWTVELRTEGRTIRASGELVWVPPPSPWPSVAIAIAIALGVVLLTRTSVWRDALATALALLVLSDLAHVVGLWNATTATTASNLRESAYSLAGVALGVFALAWMWRRGAESAMPLVLIAAIFLFVAGGLADVSTLGHSLVPTTFPTVVARLLVTLDLGLGAGLATAAALRLRQPLRARGDERSESLARSERPRAGYPGSQ